MTSSTRPGIAPRLLLTRAPDDSRALLQGLAAQGIACTPIHAPLIGTEVTGPLPDMTGIRGLIFTSRNGVAAYRALQGPVLPAFTVGRATNRVAEQAGFPAQSADGNAEALIHWLGRLRPPAPLLHVRGTHSRGDVAARLTAQGLPCQTAILYDQPALPLPEAARAALHDTRPIVAPLYSPRTARLLVDHAPKAPLLVAAMSEAVVNAAKPLHKQQVGVAARPDSDSMLRVVVDLLTIAQSLEP